MAEKDVKQVFSFKLKILHRKLRISVFSDLF